MNDKNKTLSLETSLNKADLLKAKRMNMNTVNTKNTVSTKSMSIIMVNMITHVWLDHVLSQQFSKDIKDELVKKDAKHKDDYEKNYKN